MKSPGVTVKPLKQITGDAEFNEVYFDNVRVHESQILGGVNNGWAVGLTTLMYERLALGFGLQVRLRIALDGLVDLARNTREERRAGDQGPGDAPEAGPDVDRHRGVQVHRARARSPSCSRASCPGPRPPPARWCGSRATSGCRSSPWRSRARTRQLTQGSDWAVDGGLWQHTFLRSRANSIEGGTTEIQKNIIGERVLGLPKG